VINTLLILYHFEDHCGARWRKFWSYRALTVNLEAVLESQNQSNLESEDDKCLARFFLKYQLCKATFAQVPHRVYTVLSHYKLAFVKMFA